jgi:hypothetical protein
VLVRHRLSGVRRHEPEAQGGGARP